MDEIYRSFGAIPKDPEPSDQDQEAEVSPEVTPQVQEVRLILDSESYRQIRNVAHRQFILSRGRDLSAPTIESYLFWLVNQDLDRVKKDIAKRRRI